MRRRCLRRFLPLDAARSLPEGTMNIESFFRRLADSRVPGSGTLRLLQSVLGLAAPVYGAGAWTNRVLHETGIRQRNRLPVPVFSVGNVTLGGTGKTPFAAWLCQWLQSEGRRPAILTRGYGREDADQLVVVHDGETLLAGTREAGDEPVALARALRTVPVIACADRHRGGRAAIRRFHPDTLVLDDGLQHVSLERQAEIILLDATRPLDELRLFPRGTLREPLGVLERAHLLVLTRCDQSKRSERLFRGLRRRLSHIPAVRTRVEVIWLVNLGNGERRRVADWTGRRVLLACAVGHPGAVRATVESLQISIAGAKTLADHARLTKKDILTWESSRKRLRAEAVLVTSKDAAKLRELGRLPETFWMLDARLAFVTEGDEATAKKALRARLHSGGVRGYLR
nr:tetraacyldisaccharide 4'-kinase [Candidatus Poribacteria bacterium]